MCCPDEGGQGGRPRRRYKLCGADVGRCRARQKDVDVSCSFRVVIRGNLMRLSDSGGDEVASCPLVVVKRDVDWQCGRVLRLRWSSPGGVALAGTCCCCCCCCCRREAPGPADLPVNKPRHCSGSTQWQPLVAARWGAPARAAALAPVRILGQSEVVAG